MDQSNEWPSGEERVAHYRAMGREAMEYAQKALTDDHRAVLLDIASNWAALADEVERQVSRDAHIAAIDAA